MTRVPSLAGCRIGYVPYNPQFTAPGDRRRFVHYARKRGLDIEIADSRKKYDLVVLSERADISVWCDWRGGKIVYDLIDSYLAIPPSDWKGRLRGIAKFAVGQSRRLRVDYRDAVAEMCRRADAVICTTDEQKSDISEYCKNVHIVLDMQTMVVAMKKEEFEPHTPFRLVWEGLPGTLASLSQFAVVVEKIAKQFPIELVVVTDRQCFRYLGSIGQIRADRCISRMSRCYRWSEWQEANLARRITECDLAVIPLDQNDPFANGKPENKLILFWRLGMPVLVSATPAYRRAMQGAGLDLYCTGLDEWEEKILRLAQDKELRREAGRRGCSYAEAHCGEEKLLQRWDAVFCSMGF